MSDSIKKNIQLIIDGLYNNSKLLLETKEIQKLKEYELDILSDNLIHQLYNNLLFFYNKYGKNTIKTEEEKYIYTQIVNILDIIKEYDCDYFSTNDSVKSALIYLIYSFKSSMKINLEIALKIFFSFSDIIENITSEKINKEVDKFEEYIVGTIKFLINNFSADSSEARFDLSFLAKKNNYNEIMNYLTKHKQILPIYLQCFIGYNKKSNQ